MMKISDSGLRLITRFEGFCGKAYKLSGEKHYTIGYGHYGSDVRKGQTITKKAAYELLRKDAARFEGYVRQYATISLNQNQFDALVSYCYNRGPGGLKELCANSRTAAEYSENIVKYWGSAERYKEGLLNRRRAEKALFDTQVREVHDMDTLKKGCEGQQVRALQAVLHYAYAYNLSVDGRFGEHTEEAVRTFQRTWGLVVDGVVGPKTWEKLLVDVNLM